MNVKIMKSLQTFLSKTDEEMSKIIGTTCKEWTNILNGIEMNVNQMYLLTNETNISMDYLLKDKVKTVMDQKFSRFMENNEYLAKKNVGRDELKKFYTMMKLDSKISLETLEKCFIKGSKQDYSCVNIFKLLDLDDYDVYIKMYNQYKPRIGDKQYVDSEKIQNKVLDLISQNIISDFRFVKLFNLDKDKYNNNKKKLLHYFRKGKLKWNSNAILEIINSGGVCTRLVDVRESTGPTYEDDYFTTKLLKDYCERNIKE